MTAADDTAGRLAHTLAGLGEVRLDATLDVMRSATLAAAQPTSRVPTATLPALAVSRPGAPAGDFEVLGLLGEGGMGIVELARQRSLGRDVAVKRLRDPDDAVAAAALVCEAAVTGSLEHPGIVPVHALGRDATGRPLMVMKKVEGVTLRELLDDPAHPRWREVEDRLAFFVGVVRRLCDALALAHARGIVHRDIKPENVMLGPYGEVHLLDWGIAVRVGEALPPGAIAGTPVYMAPEMLRPQSGEIGPATDVYLLGATLHDCVTGAPPHGPPEGAKTILAVLLAVADAGPRAYGPEVPEELAALLTRAMQPRVADRFPDVRALGRALDAFVAHRAAATLAQSAEERLGALEAAIVSGAATTTIHGIFHECRFGFEQSLRDHPEQPRAKSGLRRALLRMGEHAHAHGDRAVLEAMIDALGDASEAGTLRASLADLDRAVALEAAERERLRQFEREHDLRASERERSIVSRVMAVVLVVMLPTIGWLVATGRLSVTANSLLAFTVPPVVLVGVTLALFRRRLVRNRVDRQIVLSVVTVAATVLVHRILGAARGWSLGDVTSGDAFVVAAVAAVTALTIKRLYFVVAALFLCGGVLAPFLGTYAFVPILGAAVLSVACVVAAPRALEAPALGTVTGAPAPQAGAARPGA